MLNAVYLCHVKFYPYEKKKGGGGSLSHTGGRHKHLWSNWYVVA